MCISSLLSNSKSLARLVHYKVTPKAKRTAKLLSVETLDTTAQQQIFARFQDNPEAFWEPPTCGLHAQLGRRVAHIAMYLRSRLHPDHLPSSTIAVFVPDPSATKHRYVGKRYVEIARRLGGMGAVFCLPLDIPDSTYERYLGWEGQASDHLVSLRLPEVARSYTSFVQKLISVQLQDDPSYLNLAVEFGDILPDSDHLLLLAHALGGLHTPGLLFSSVKQARRRWGGDGYIRPVGAVEFGLPLELVRLLSDDERVSRAATQLDMTQRQVDGELVWSLPRAVPALANLDSETNELWEVAALRLVCFACPPSNEDSPPWPATARRALWAVMDRLTGKSIPSNLRDQVLEALLPFAEHGPVDVRHTAVERAENLLQQTTPLWLQSSVALYQSILMRLEGDFSGSDSKILGSPGPSQGINRREHALAGRLQLSLVENMLQRQNDQGSAAMLSDWQPIQPPSPLETDTNVRLLLTTTKFFQSVAMFSSARDSLEQALGLLIPPKVRPLALARLADVYCELDLHDRASAIVEPEIEAMTKQEKRGRLLKRLILAAAEADIGRDRFGEAEARLEAMHDSKTTAPLDITDQLLRVRTLIAQARIPHYKHQFAEALRRWQIALADIQGHSSFENGRGFTSAIVHLSIAHAQLNTGDTQSGIRSRVLAMEILRVKKPDYWIPVIATKWLSKVSSEVYEMIGS
ncbi:hypothetical protein RB600_001487 [Gaeumannomyces tritici]